MQISVPWLKNFCKARFTLPGTKPNMWLQTSVTIITPFETLILYTPLCATSLNASQHGYALFCPWMQHTRAWAERPLMPLWTQYYFPHLTSAVGWADEEWGVEVLEDRTVTCETVNVCVLQFWKHHIPKVYIPPNCNLYFCKFSSLLIKDFKGLTVSYSTLLVMTFIHSLGFNNRNHYFLF